MPSLGSHVQYSGTPRRLRPLFSKFHAAGPKTACAQGPDCGKLRASDRRIARRFFVYLLRLVLKNSLRHKLRTSLTVVGIVVAITAFGLLRTIVDAWYAGANASSSARLVTRNSISLVFPLPFNYAQ